MIRRTENLVLLLGVGVVLCNGSVLAQPQPHTWSTTVEFQQGSFINLNDATVADELQINTWQETKTSNPPVLPYLWVALSGRGTIVRIATTTFDPLTGNTVSIGDILGEYWTAPEGCRDTSGQFNGPARTTVDFDGGVWVANRNDINSPSEGHIVKIGNGLAFQWIDRVINNPNPPILDTSLVSTPNRPIMQASLLLSTTGGCTHVL